RRPVRAGRRVSKGVWGCLKSEIYTGADHTEIVFRTIHEIPAEITDPPDMWRKTYFKSTPDLTERLGLGSCEAFGLDDVKAFSGSNDAYIFRSLATTKNGPTAPENIWRKTGTRNWVAQCEGPQRSTDRVRGAAGAALKDRK